MNYLINHLGWVALAIATIGTVLWVSKGPGARYTAVWWFAALLLWVASLHR